MLTEYNMTSKEYIELDKLQDEVINTLQNHFGSFYIGGSVALAKFYCDHRYAGDLDLFVNRDPDFWLKAGQIIKALQTKLNIPDENIFHYDNHVSIFYKAGEALLKIDVGNELCERWKSSYMAGIIPVESVADMLANKIKIVMDRDLRLDLFDIITIASNYSFQWSPVIEHALRKEIGYQAYNFKRIGLSALKYHQLLKGGEPKNAFEFLGIEAPWGQDLICATASATVLENGINQEGNFLQSPLDSVNTFSTLGEFGAELIRVAGRLFALLEPDLPIPEEVLRTIPTSIGVKWGGAFFMVQRNPTVTIAAVAQRFSTFHQKNYEEAGWLKNQLKITELRENARQIEFDLIHSGLNTLGVGKPHLEEANPKKG